MMQSPEKRGVSTASSIQEGGQVPAGPVSPTSIARSLSGKQKETRDLLVRLAPYLEQANAIVDNLSPIVALVGRKIKKLRAIAQPYHPEEYAPLLVGFFLVFFGGMYVTTVAAIEAYRIMGWAATYHGLHTIYLNYYAAKQASQKDDEVDDNKDGIPDVKQIPKDQLISRKIKLVLKSIDPQQVSEACQGILAGWFAVAATLRLKFAQAVTLGVSLGEIIEKHAFPFVNPILLASVPKEYQKWVPVVLSYVCRSIGVSIAWTLQRVISSFYSAIRGSSIFCTALLALAQKRGWIKKGDLVVGSAAFNGISTILAAVGFIWQVRSGFSLFFPLNLLLFPLTVFEWVFTFLINFMD